MERDLNRADIERIRRIYQKMRERGLKGPWVADSNGTFSLSAETWIHLQENPDEADAYEDSLEELMSETPSRKY